MSSGWLPGFFIILLDLVLFAEYIFLVVHNFRFSDRLDICSVSNSKALLLQFYAFAHAGSDQI